MFDVVKDTRAWIENMVVGLNLCPFADRVLKANLVRFVVSEVSSTEDILGKLAEELNRLSKAPRTEIETTLLILPNALPDFLDYNDFLELADALLVDMELDGEIQLASFHPNYQFAETTPDAPENYTNRSPYPMLHLLREVSITEVAKSTDELLEIPKRNVETLKRLGLSGIRALSRFDDPE